MDLAEALYATSLASLVPSGEPLPDPIEEQQAAELDWLEQRSGKLTCSNFGKLMSKGKTKAQPFSQTGMAYLHGVVGERLGSTLPNATNAAMRWGNENEEPGISEYQARRTFETVVYQSKTFVQYNDSVGGSPDFLVNDDGCGEIKCPHNPGVHINTWQKQEVPAEYLWQCIGHMLITERDWCDFVSFDPRIPEGDNARLCIIRLDRDEEQIEQLKGRLIEAVHYVEDVVKSIRSNQTAQQIRSMVSDMTSRDKELLLLELSK